MLVVLCVETVAKPPPISSSSYPSHHASHILVVIKRYCPAAQVHEGIVDHYAPPRTIFSREFMSSLPIDNNGFQAHCYLGSGGSQDPSLDWVGKFFGLYLIENGDTSSDTWKQLYAGGEGSIANDPMLSRFKVSLGN